MNKREKRINAVRMLRAAINDSFSRHPMYDKEYCHDNCDKCANCKVAPFIVSFYDHKHNYLVSNWLCNSYNVNSYSSSQLINDLSEYFDIDIAHLMWGGADELLHKIRYIRIGTRNDLLFDENGYSYTTETGIEYDVHGKNIERYYSKWYIGSPEIQEEWEKGCF